MHELCEVIKKMLIVQITILQVIPVVPQTNSPQVALSKPDNVHGSPYDVTHISYAVEQSEA